MRERERERERAASAKAESASDAEGRREISSLAVAHPGNNDLFLESTPIDFEWKRSPIYVPLDPFFPSISEISGNLSIFERLKLKNHKERTTKKKGARRC